MRFIKTLAAGAVALWLLSGCGGGGGDTAAIVSPPKSGGGDGTQPTEPRTTVEGLWKGRTNNLPSRDFRGVVLPDGSFWFVYSRVGNADFADGFLNGTRDFEPFHTENAQEYSIADGTVYRTAFSGSYRVKSEFQGALGRLNDSFFTNYDHAYDSAATLSTAVGTYTGTASQIVNSTAAADTSESISLVVGADGRFTASGSAACRFTGKIAARQAGVFDAEVVFPASGCSINGVTFTRGIAFLDPSLRRIYVIARNLDRTDALLFMGDRSL